MSPAVCLRKTVACAFTLILLSLAGWTEGRAQGQQSLEGGGAGSAASTFGSPPSSFQCPEKNGVFPDAYQCDLYYKCVKGVAEEKLCPDGLVFDDSKTNHELCDIPANVDCGKRSELQDPQPTAQCPRANGYFRHSDPSVCDKFVNCIEGVAHELPCPPGLVYDDVRSTCDWPAQGRRADCGPQKKDALEDGFTCPDGEVMGPTGRPLPHPTFPHPDDCQRFYICRNGVRPQEGSCGAGEVYNEHTFKCDEPANVSGCEKWFETGKATLTNNAA